MSRIYLQRAARIKQERKKRGLRREPVHVANNRTSVGERKVVAILLATSHDTASSSDVRASTEPCIIDDTCDCFEASRPCVKSQWMMRVSGCSYLGMVFTTERAYGPVNKSSEQVKLL